MISDYAIDALNKHPVETAPWDEPACDCPRCGDPRCESERVCAACRTEAMAVARDVVEPALAWCREKLGIVAQWSELRPADHRDHRAGSRSHDPMGSAANSPWASDAGSNPADSTTADRDTVTAGAIPVQGGQTVRAPEADEPAAALSVESIYDLIRSHAGFMLLVASW